MNQSLLQGLASLRAVNGNQSKLDAIYDELVEGLKSGLKEILCGKQKKGQIWFTKELASLRIRRNYTIRESEWLRSKMKDNRDMRRLYLETRKTYSKVVKSAKRAHLRSMRDRLEQELQCPKKFWKSVKRMKIGNQGKAMRDLFEVYDGAGKIRTGEEAVKV